MTSCDMKKPDEALYDKIWQAMIWKGLMCYGLDLWETEDSLPKKPLADRVLGRIVIIINIVIILIIFINIFCHHHHHRFLPKKPLADRVLGRKIIIIVTNLIILSNNLKQCLIVKTWFVNNVLSKQYLVTKSSEIWVKRCNHI